MNGFRLGPVLAISGALLAACVGAAFAEGEIDRFIGGFALSCSLFYIVLGIWFYGWERNHG